MIAMLCDATDFCSRCGATSVVFKCRTCRKVSYCDEHCRQYDRPRHRNACQIINWKEQLIIDRLLFTASLNGDLPRVSLLIAKGGDVNWAHPDTKCTPLHVASGMGHLSVVNALIAARAVVDRVNVNGFTALMIAAEYGHEAVVIALHRVAGASVHHVNSRGRTALHQAAQNGHLGVVRYLLRAAANPNVVSTDGNGGTPLILASQNGHLAVVQALIEAGANVNHSRPHDGFTSLSLAAQNGHIEVVRALLAAGAKCRC